jgi:translocation and assembly module TamB
MDFSIAGQPLGEISGNVKLHAMASPERDRIMMRVDVPDLNVSVPATALSAGVQELSEREDVRVGVYLGPDTFVKLPMDRGDYERTERSEPGEGIALDVDVRLANVTLVYGKLARVVLRGNPRLTVVAGETSVTGRIEATQGTIEIQGKEFEIEKATVTFQPDDASNPVVVATASWTAPEGTKVLADFVGPVDTGRLNLRSEPARPQNEILALILFGTAEGMNARPPPGREAGAGMQAAKTLGGLAVEGLTAALQDLTGVRATARIDTSRARNPAPEIEMQISPRVSVEYSHVLGTPPLSRPDKNLVSFEWRISRRWSLETTVGDRGTVQMDAVWQKRY